VYHLLLVSSPRWGELHPPLACQLHEGLISHGDHLTHRCPRWTQDLAAQMGWAPEAA
jgi:hypothetical protein